MKVKEENNKNLFSLKRNNNESWNSELEKYKDGSIKNKNRRRKIKIHSYKKVYNNVSQKYICVGGN